MNDIPKYIIGLLDQEIFNIKSFNNSTIGLKPNFVANESDRYSLATGMTGDLYKEVESGNFYVLVDPTNIDNPDGWKFISNTFLTTPEDVKDYIGFLEYLKNNMKSIYNVYQYTKGWF